jgi:hypothetical protein
MIGTTKHCLRKVLGRLQVSEEGLNSTFVAIEAAIKSRPIVQAEDEAGALTPAHFLTGETNGNTIWTRAGDEREPIKRIQDATEARRRLLETWQREYLTTLRSFHEVRQQQASTKCRRGDALLQEDVRPRHMWKKAVIEQLIEGPDGMIRTMVLRTPEWNKITHPIQLVNPLEVEQGGEDLGEHLSS